MLAKRLIEHHRSRKSHAKRMLPHDLSPSALLLGIHSAERIRARFKLANAEIDSPPHSNYPASHFDAHSPHLNVRDIPQVLHFSLPGMEPKRAALLHPISRRVL